MKNKGFTILELLAVIVVLAIIALIATPIILNIVDDARKKTFEADSMSIEKKVLVYATEKGITGSFEINNGTVSFDGEILTDLIINNKNYSGKVVIEDDGTTSFSLNNVKWCSVKNNEENVEIKDYKSGECKNTGKGVDTLMELVSDEPTTREGCTGNGLFTKVTHDNGDVDYRYSGACPNNYVSFNNEVWRIIGVFDGRIKIMRDEKLDTDRKWDCPGGDDGSCDGYKNNWETSTLKTYLNGNYYDSISSEYQAMIDDRVTWYLGGWSTSDITKDVIYGYERSGEVGTIYGSNPKISTTTKIGLIYLSDYGYAAEEGDSKCPSTTNLGSYSTDGCRNNNWMYKSYLWWNIAPNSSRSDHTWIVRSTGNVFRCDVNNSTGVHPTLYLKPSVKITGGDGTSSTSDKIYTLG